MARRITDVTAPALEQTAPEANKVSEQDIVIDLRNGVQIDIRETVSTRRFLGSDEGLLGADDELLVIKRVIDILGSLFFIVLLSPVMLITALLVAATSRGPILYWQERVGKNSKPFRMAKFRSMYRDADERLANLVVLNEADGPVFKIRNDPRITPVGRVIRKLSIDELPQLFHVLAGTMSLVGPRPPLRAETELYDRWAKQRLLVKPGITCIWQVSGRSDLDFQTWVAMDIEYIANWSPMLDASILLRTVPAVVTGRGAY